MDFSQSALNALKSTEQFAAKAYKDGFVDGVQMYSIGYGHQIKSNEQNLKTATITVAQAETLMRQDLAPLKAQLNGAKYKFNQNQFDALISFGYNCGSGALAKVITTWNTTHDAKQVTAQMALYTKTTVDGVKTASSALEKRRASEILQFNAPYIPVLTICLCAVGLLLFLS